MNDLLTESFEIPRGQGHGGGGDIELGEYARNSGDLGLDSFFRKVQELDKQYAKLDKLLKKLQDAHEESKAVTKAPSMKAIKQRMEKDVDEVKKTAHYLKTKIEELDKENLANRQKPRVWKRIRCLTGQEQRQPFSLKKKLKDKMG
uniref:Syntaxin N-terminal domain-containing protein n=1 Tax=Glycine max TaxID=3847 RepID=C6SYY1_SOYBN|nr:unknown [Glycine max]